MADDPRRLPVFVYGTLMPGLRNYAWFLRGGTVAEVPARLAGAVLYEGPGFPHAVAAPGGEVRGVLITLVPDRYGALLAALDELEGCVPGGPGNLFDRVEREVALVAGGTARAWVYLASGRVARQLRATGTLVPGGVWRE
ncbi:gamma-glutamylcyclotransferase [Streptomyces sp. AV19]|uniref:gamma-glutamylcyclotransferase family protein n=1 Tax=Streptomyces sp. AV19 TaxID=2793068 RepID=UPI0018FE9F88|nr:gamma-glutamylcyclotransferase family protein [Streptomyces sp. AV19]MBH1937884.1 gamma-glutamylcyclotransferase [Streptomyces sp. AV19]MDG4536517.1 gamma-glutamylcyclotransferase [Streptomyces sp. AV19]